MTITKSLRPIFSRPQEDQIALGVIVEVSGASATVLLDRKFAELCPPIGSLLTVNLKNAIVLCLITSMRTPGADDLSQQNEERIVKVELVGELVREPDGYLRAFQRGVSRVPTLGDHVYAPTDEALSKAYRYGPSEGITIGTIHQNRSIPAVVNVEDLLSKHFAIVGSTGTGKSCTAALILRQVLAKHPNAHIILLDPHSEYGTCFQGMVELVRPSDLALPFWILNFEEIVEVLIGDAREYAAEVELLRDLVPVAKYNHARHRRSTGASLARERFSVDVPVPYRISDLISLIETQMGRLEMKNSLGPLKNLKARIESATMDVRYGFMFGSVAVENTVKDVLKRLFRLPVAGRPITVLQLTGLPSEITNVIVSVLARLAFDVAMWSDGKIPMTFVCEEAHRYVPRDGHAGFEPTKRALGRIAKEGRKYGLSLGIVSQRPGEIDPTILSQCSTLFTMRLSNEQDQKIVRSALSDSAKSLLDFLPSLGTRETIIFGEGVSLASRVRLSKLPENALPRGHSNGFSIAWKNDLKEDDFLDHIISRWCSASQARDGRLDRATATVDAAPDNTVYDDAGPSARELVSDTPDQAYAAPPMPRKGASFGRKPIPRPEPTNNAATNIDESVTSPTLERLAQRLRDMKS